MTTFTCARIMRLFPIIRVRTYSHYDVYISRAKLLLPFTCNFYYSYYSLRIVVNFLLPFIHIPHWTAQMMDSERALTFYSPFLDEGKEQRLVEASCVFPRMRFFPAIVSNLHIITGACHVIHVSQAHAHFGQSGNTAIKVFTCLYISIKIGVRHLC